MDKMSKKEREAIRIMESLGMPIIRTDHIKSTKMIHELKILPMYFNPVVEMTKPFEVRSEKDRTFAVNDELLLKEFVPKGYYETEDKEYYTGRICHRVITYKLQLADDLVVLGLARK